MHKLDTFVISLDEFVSELALDPVIGQMLGKRSPGLYDNNGARVVGVNRLYRVTSKENRGITALGQDLFAVWTPIKAHAMVVLDPKLINDGLIRTICAPTTEATGMNAQIFEDLLKSSMDDLGNFRTLGLGTIAAHPGLRLVDCAKEASALAKGMSYQPIRITPSWSNEWERESPYWGARQLMLALIRHLMYFQLRCHTNDIPRGRDDISTADSAYNLVLVVLMSRYIQENRIQFPQYAHLEDPIECPMNWIGLPDDKDVENYDPHFIRARDLAGTLLTKINQKVEPYRAHYHSCRISGNMLIIDRYEDARAILLEKLLKIPEAYQCITDMASRYVHSMDTSSVLSQYTAPSPLE